MLHRHPSAYRAPSPHPRRSEARRRPVRDGLWVGLQGLEPRLMLATHYVEFDAGPGGDGSLSSPFQSLQQAIDNAVVDDGDTIVLGDGAYQATETIEVDKELTILSANGPAETSITFLAADAGLRIQVDNVTLGQAGAGLSLIGSNETTSLIRLLDARNGVSIEGNTLRSIGGAEQAVSLLQGTNLSINGNTFDLDDGDIAISFNPSDTIADSIYVTIADNTFNGAEGQTQRAIVLGNLNTIAISGNTFTRAGIEVRIGDTNPSVGLEIAGNSFEQAAVTLKRQDAESTQALTGLDVHDNLFRQSGGLILYAEEADTEQSLQAENLPEPILFNENVFLEFAVGEEGLSAGLAGPVDLSGVTIDARNNFWGGAAGPRTAGNLYNVDLQTVAIGNLAGAAIDYFPWWAEYSEDDEGFTGDAHVPAKIGTTPYPTLSEALAAAEEGDTIIAADGVFHEDLVIATPNITLRSTGGEQLTTIRLVDGVGIDVQGNASGFTLGGANAGFTIVGGDSTTFLIQLTNGPTDVTVRGNTLDLSGAASMGISIGVAGAENLAIRNNAFSADDGDGCIWGPSVSGASINNNVFTGPDLPASGYALQLRGPDGSTTISDNIITGFNLGIVLTDGDGSSGVTVTGNTLTNTNTGIYLGADGSTGDLRDVTITGNSLAEGDRGIRIIDAETLLADTFTISDNSFASFDVAAIDNQHGSRSVNLDDNWWDSANGPTVASNTFNVDEQGETALGRFSLASWLDAVGGASFSPVRIGSDGFTSITSSLAAAADGDTLIAADGVFTEDLGVGTPNITLRSTNGAQATTLQLVDGAGIGIGGDADGFTLGGVNMGFTIRGGDATTYLVQIAANPADVTFRGNAFDLAGPATRGISVSTTGATNLTVQQNDFAAEDGDEAIWGAGIVGATIRGNTFIGPGTATEGYALALRGAAPTTTIAENTISGFHRGVVLYDGDGSDGVAISDNTITDNIIGVELGAQSSTGYLENVSITGNAISGGDVGVRIANATRVLADTFSISGNDFSGFITAAVDNQHPGRRVSVNGNWWGSANGPTASANTYNVGDQGQVAKGPIRLDTWLATADGQAFSPVTIGTEGFASIQAALSAAEDGDTVTAVEGTFTEDLTIDTPNVTLRSSAGAEGTTIHLVDGLGLNVQDGAVGFELGDEAAGFSFVGGDATTSLIQLTGGPADVKIRGNRFDLAGPAIYGVFVDTAGANRLAIEANLFTADDGDGAVRVSSASGVTIADNSFAGPDTPTDGYAVRLSGGNADTSIHGNTIERFHFGIVLNNGAGSDGVTVADNTLTDNTTGIQLGSDGAAGDLRGVTITNNTLANGDSGIVVLDSIAVKPGSFAITGNLFSGFATAAVDNRNAASTLPAERNYWNAPDGPSNVGGSGETILGEVNVTPWYATESTTEDNAPVSLSRDGIETLLSDTIGGALAGDLAGDVITAGDGAFAEDLIIDAADVTLRSANGAAAVTLELVDGIGIDVQADGFTLGGADAGFTIVSSSATTRAIELADSLSDVTIQGNAISTAGAATRGLSMSATTNLELLDNVFSFDASDLAVTWNPGATDAVADATTIHGNRFTAVAGSSGTAVRVGNIANGMDIRANELGSSITVYVGGGGVQSVGLTIADNHFTPGGNNLNGRCIVFTREGNAATGQLSNVSITGNSFDQQYAGIVFNGAADPSGIVPANIDWDSLVIFENGFDGVPQALLVFGAKLDETVTVNASGNWWGSTSAPDNIFLGAFGDQAQANIDYTPFLNTGDVDDDPANGFEGDFAVLHVDASSAQRDNQGRINEALDLLTGSVLHLLPGEYVEDVILPAHLSGIELAGAYDDNPAATLIRGVAVAQAGTAPEEVDTWNVQIDAEDADIHGIAFVSPDLPDDTFAPGMLVAADGVRIRDNAFRVRSGNDADEVSTAITTRVDGDGAGLTIERNLFNSLGEQTVGYRGIDLGPTAAAPAQAIVSGNEILGDVFEGLRVARSNVLIRRNAVLTDLPFDDAETVAPGEAGRGMVIAEDTPAVQRDVLLHGNSVRGFTVGVEVGATGQELADVVLSDDPAGGVQGNSLSRNFIGLRVNASADEVTVSGNDIFDNSAKDGPGYGVRNLDSVDLLATGNYWGDRRGPFNPTHNPRGRGNRVTDNVTLGSYQQHKLIPQVDLIGDVRTNLPSTAAPGDRTNVVVRVTNQEDDRAVGLARISLYLSQDAQLDIGTDVFWASNEVRVRIAGGRSRSYQLTGLVLPDTALSGTNYHVLAVLDSDDSITETSALNNVAVERETHSVVYQFGNVQGRSNVSLRLTDNADGTPAVFRLRGQTGRGTVVRSGDGFAVTFVDTDLSSRASIDIDTRFSDTDDDSVTLFGLTVGDSANPEDVTSLRRLIGHGVDLAGSCNVAGVITDLRLGDVGNGEQVRISYLNQDGYDRNLRMQLESIEGLRVRTPGLSFARFQADSWTDDGDGLAELLTAAAVNNLRVNGDFEADLSLSSLGTVRVGGDVLAADWNLGDANARRVLVDGSFQVTNVTATSFRRLDIGGNLEESTFVLSQNRGFSTKRLIIGGMVREATLLCTGDVRQARFGGMDGSVLALGTNATAETDFAVADLAFTGVGAGVDTFIVNGDAATDQGHSFTNSLVMAWEIRRARLENVQTLNADGAGYEGFLGSAGDHGLYATDRVSNRPIRRVRYQPTAGERTVVRSADLPASEDDFTIAVE